ncbi:hypothetical protein GF318_01820 [Candidatus Micrarchaeota archaeon]|nr:hypothetical protein [Candidatus Micrarchaeota archaeon]
MRRLKNQEMSANPADLKDKPARKKGMLNRFKRAAATGALALGLALGTAPLVVPAVAQANQTTRVLGQEVPFGRLDRTLREMEQEMNEIGRVDEHFPDETYDYYWRGVDVPGFRIIVSLRPEGEHRNRVTVRFPAERETNPDLEGRDRGARGMDIDRFAGMVEEMTGGPLERVKIITNSGTFRSGGEDVPYTNAYILPVDDQGRVTTSLGEGQYLAFTVTYWGSRVVGSSAVIAEPDNITTMRVASR